ncbi:MAG: LLM class flavin-dependent oxidoreductase [Janthinobacterium lividum]
MTGTSRPRLVLAVELDGAGRHPAAWRLPAARPHELFTAAHWRRLAATVDEADLDFLTLPDSFHLASGDDGEQRGRLDAVATAAHLAPLTRRTGLVPVITTTHTEPFHTSKALATLDFTSLGRAGWQVEVSTTSEEALAFGRRAVETTDALWREAGESVQVVRALWDSWEDDAIVRDLATGRYVDVEKLHHIDFVGSTFSVKGPSITPRSPQGQPPVVVPVRDAPSRALAAAHADVARIEAPDEATALASVRALRAEAGARPLIVLVDVEVALRAHAAEARAVRTELDDLAPRHDPRSLRQVGNPASLTAFLRALTEQDAGVDGVVLVPLDLPVSLDLVAAEVLPALRAQGLRPPVRVRGRGPAPTLRDRLGLNRPASVYAGA